MDFTGEAVLAVERPAVYAAVRDLATYPGWFTIVDRADPLADPLADPGVWAVELAARLGPLKRTKRVTMRRVTDDPADGHARFERAEPDGRDHSPWVLDARVSPAGTGSGADDDASTRLRMTIHYGGVAWLPGVDLLLREEAKRAAGRLERLLTTGP